MKIRILHILASNKYSGAEKVVCDIITHTSNTFEHCYCSPKGPIKTILSEKNIFYMPIDKLNIKNIRRVLKSYRPDIIHAHDFRASILASICKSNQKLIFHIHNNSPWIKRPFMRSLLFLVASSRANIILSVSKSITSEYIFSSCIKHKTTNVNNPNDREQILNKITPKHSISNKYDICCVARMTKAKNPYRFLRIINELKKTNNRIKAIWVGDGELRNKILAKCEKMNIKENVTFIGFSSNPYGYVNQSKIFLLTSDWEGYGLSAYEALTLGKPCVVSKVGGLKEIIDNRCGKLCNKTRLSEYTEEIEKLLNDAAYYEKKSKNALRKSIKLDNKREYYRKMNNIYSKLKSEIR